MGRIYCSAPLDLFVDADLGDDSNDGLTAATAKKTLLEAWLLGAAGYDLAGQQATLHLAPAAAHYAPLSTNIGWLGQAGYAGVLIKGDAPNSQRVVIDGGDGTAILLGSGSSCGVQAKFANLSIVSAGGSGIYVFGSGNGAIASNLTFLGCPGSAIVGAHGAEVAFQEYILFLGSYYGNLAQVVTDGRFTGGESATWAIGQPTSVGPQGAVFNQGGTMNLGGLVSVNPRLVAGVQGSVTYGRTLTGGYQDNIPGHSGTMAVGAGGFLT